MECWIFLWTNVHSLTFSTRLFMVGHMWIDPRTGTFMSFWCTYQHMFMSSLCIYQHILFCICFWPHVETSHLGMFIFLLCIYDSCLCHCYGYTNICFMARFYGNMIEWSKIKVCLWHYYVYNSTCSWYCYVYTNNRFLELNPVGMQFDKEHSQGLVWGRQVSRYWDEVW